MLAKTVKKWEAFGSRKKAMAFLNERMSSDGSRPLVLWECGGEGHGYACLLLTDNSVIFVHEKSQGPWVETVVAVEPGAASRIHDSATRLAGYSGDASLFANDGFSYFCTIWDLDAKPLNIFAVFGLDAALSPGMARANPDFVSSVRPALSVLESVCRVSGMNLHGDRYVPGGPVNPQ